LRPSASFARDLEELIRIKPTGANNWPYLLAIDYMHSLLISKPRLLKEESLEELVDGLYRLSYFYALHSKDHLSYLVSCAGVALVNNKSVASSMTVRMRMLHMMTSFEMGYAAETLRWFRQLRKLDPELKSQLDQGTRFQLYNNLGLVSKLFTGEDPMVFYSKALENTDDPTETAMANINIANHHYDMRDFSAALNISREVEKLSYSLDIVNPAYVRGNALICQLKVHLQTGSLIDAGQVVARLEALSSEYPEWLDEPLAYVFLGHYYIEVNNYRTAKKYLGLLDRMTASAKTKYIEGESLVLSAALLNRSSKKFQALERLVKAFEFLGAYKLVSPHLRDLVSNLLQSIIAIFRELINDLEQKDGYTALHTLRVSKISYAVGKSLGLSNVDLFYLAVGAMLHDYGKVDIPTSILNKPAKLTKEEFDIIKRHPEMGAHYLENLAFPAQVRDIVLSHHERSDGLGYPKGLKDGEIPQVVQIVAICDVYDALTTDRPYRTAQSRHEVMTYLEEQGETIVEKDVFEAFNKALQNSEYETTLEEFEKVWYEILYGLFFLEKNGAFAPST
ncbi:MAG TPA: metal-dependent phosphohydrolase, partial [Kosmotogaceae bacterium]|nr:metal-dependent phosphohydrolase [Kosmotogaceae bacterium]